MSKQGIDFQSHGLPPLASKSGLIWEKNQGGFWKVCGMKGVQVGLGDSVGGGEGGGEGAN